MGLALRTVFPCSSSEWAESERPIVLVVTASLPAQTLTVILSFLVFFFLLYFIFLSVLIVLFRGGPA